MNYIVMSGDGSNTSEDDIYAQKVIVEFRKQTGWDVFPETRIYTDLTKFSKRYSKQKRDVSEVVVIFRMAHKMLKHE